MEGEVATTIRSRAKGLDLRAQGTSSQRCGKLLEGSGVQQVNWMAHGRVPRSEWLRMLSTTVALSPRRTATRHRRFVSSPNAAPAFLGSQHRRARPPGRRSSLDTEVVQHPQHRLLARPDHLGNLRERSPRPIQLRGLRLTLDGHRPPAPLDQALVDVATHRVAMDPVRAGKLQHPDTTLVVGYQRSATRRGQRSSHRPLWCRDVPPSVLRRSPIRPSPSRQDTLLQTADKHLYRVGQVLKLSPRCSSSAGCDQRGAREMTRTSGIEGVTTPTSDTRRSS